MISYSFATTPPDVPATTMVITPPPEYGAGDFLVMGVCGNTAAGTPTGCNTPSGWTALSSSGSPLAVFWKNATGSEPTSYTVTMSAACNAAVFIAAYPAATVNSHLFANSAAGVVTYSPTRPTGVTSAEIVLMVAGAAASTGAVKNPVGGQNFDFPTGFTVEVPAFASWQPVTGPYTAAVGMCDVPGGALPATVTVNSVQQSTFYTGFVVITVTGAPPAPPPFTVTAVLSDPEGVPGLAVTVKELSGAAQVAQIAATGATVSWYANTVSSAPQQPITPSASGSLIYGAVSEVYSVTTPAAYVPNGATVFTQNIADANTPGNFGTFRSSGTTSSGVAVTIGATTPVNAFTNLAMAEILASPGNSLSEVASGVAAGMTPGSYSGTAVAQVVNFPVAPAIGALMVAMVSGNSRFFLGTSSSLITSSPGVVTWELLVERNYPMHTAVWAGTVTEMPYTLWNQAPGTVTSAGPDTGGTVGVHFTSSDGGLLDGLWLYSPPAEGITGLPTVIGVFLYSTQTLLHSESATWSGAAGSGWIYAPFVNSPSVAPGVAYMAAAFAAAGPVWFVYADPYTFPVVNGPLTAPADVGAGQGWYSPTGTGITFPSSQLAGTNWWLDVQVTGILITSSGGLSLASMSAGGGQVSATGALFLSTMHATGGSITCSGGVNLSAAALSGTASGPGSSGVIMDEAGNAILDEVGNEIFDETGGSGPPVGVVHVQDQHAVNGPGSIFTVDISSTTGNCLVMYITARISGDNPVYIASVTDSAENAWTYSTQEQSQEPPASGSYDASSGQYGFTAIGCCVNAASVGTVTVTLSGASAYAEVGVSEFSNVTSGSGITAGAASSTLVTGASYSTPALSLPTGAEIIVACTSALSPWSSTGSSWVLLNYADALGAYTLNTSGGTATGTFTAGAATDVPSSAILAIGPNSGTGSVITDESGNPLLDEAGNEILDESGSAPPVGELTLVATYTGGNDNNGIGPQSTTIGNTAGNLLVLFAAWCTTSAVTGSSQLPPAASVCDSAGNWWIMAADSGETCLGSRVAVWYCANALAIGTAPCDWVSTGLTGYAADLVWTVAEFSGPPQDYTPVIDFVSQSTTGDSTSTSISVDVSAGSADYCFAVGAAGSPSAVVTSGPSSPWTTIAYQSSSENSDGISAYYSYAVAATGESVSAAWPFSAGAQGSAIVIGITQASYPPSNSNVNFPYVRTQLALGANSGDPSYAVTEYQWVDITERTLSDNQAASITVSRGRQYELSQPEAGTLTIAMNNLDGAFNPSNPGSPYYSNAINSNMSFQSGTQPWSPVNGAALSTSSEFTFTSNEQAVSQQSMVITPGNAPEPGAQDMELIPAAPDTQYGFTYWVYCESAWPAGAMCTLQELNSSLGVVTTAVGSATAVPAGQWTQISMSVVTSDTVAYVQPVISINGSPPSSTQFFIAEAALVLGDTAVETGLVRLSTPVRVSAYWQGRWYAVGYGLVERWPQTWPDLPQWGFSVMVASDIVSTANNITLSSAVQGEILADAPYACFPFADNYSTTSSTINGPSSAASNANGLIAINTSRVNQRTALYVTQTQPVETGQTMNFLGDSGTGMGCSSLSDAYTGTQWGPGAVYGPDAGLPPVAAGTGSTYEIWFSFPSGMTKPTSSLVFQYLQVFCSPAISTIGAAQQSPGWLLTAGMRNPASPGATQCYVQQSTNSGAQALQVLADALPDDLHHLVVIINPGGSTQAYLDGVAYSIGTVTANGNVIAVGFGQSHYSYGNVYALWNYSLAYGTVYDYALPVGRITQHWVSGSVGFTGDTYVKRAGRYVAWSGTGIPIGGPGAVLDNASLSAAYDTDGTTLASALNNDATSSGGMWYAPGSGNLVVIPRPALYCRPSTATFGDNTQSGEIPYTAALGFDYDNTYLSNVTQATLNQGANTSVAPVQKDLASINEYGQRGPLAVTIGGQYTESAFDAAAWLLAKYKQPQVRVQQVTIDVASYPTGFNTVLQTEIADVVNVARRPVGGAPYVLETITQKVEHNIGAGYWQTTYQLSPYVQEAVVLTADTPGADVLGSTVMGW